MLGRQQIAGIPTALHELFKNAYDAFARRVEVDLLVERRALILRDDGFGMTLEEFRDRWLTLGTESKVGQTEHTADWLGGYGKIPRRILGEKGIGRLAIAAIGPVCLVLTRASRGEGLNDLVVSLIHWALFEVPGLDLDRIRIPIKTLPGGTLPDKTNMEDLISFIHESVDELENEVPEEVRSRIKADLKLMQFSPRAILESLDYEDQEKRGPSLLGDGHGTFFIVRPYDAVLDDDLATNDDAEASDLEKFLIGFGNTMLPDVPEPPIKAAFRQHRSDGDIQDFIGEREFFTPAEFLTADQIIEGQVDEFGQFTGTVKIYDRPPVSYTVNWPSAQGRPSFCGPFEVRFGYMQGLPHQSLLQKEEWIRMDAKLRRIGGLYIYRDGVRILPYGNSDYDFLNIEKRRTLAAKDWYFSFRRLFGAVLITSKSNSALQEKAGREGFRENMAYRQFKGILENLFKSLAIDFFRSNAPLGEEFSRIKDELDARNDLLRKREKLVSVRKEKFKNALRDFFEWVESGAPGEDAKLLRSKFDEKFNAVEALDDPDVMGTQLHRLEGDIRRSVDELRQKYRISRPQGVGLTKQMVSDWQAFGKVYEELETTQFSPLVDHFNQRLASVLEQRGAAINRRLLLQEVLEGRQQSIKKDASRNEREAREGLTRARDAITKGISASIYRLHNDIVTVLADFERTDVSALDGDAIVSLRSTFERRLDTTASRESQFLGKLREQMDALTESISAGVLPDDVTSALEDSNQELKEEMEESLHWAQVGTALGIVQHEFNNVVRKIKRDIGRLGPWAKGTPELRELVSGLRNGFIHLEEYLRLFAPLDRRLYRQKVELSGEEISGYVLSIFGDRFSRHDIKFDATPKFRKSTITVYPSTLLPVFVNLIDNACFWLSKSDSKKRWLRLDLCPDGILVENSGPGIERRIADRIFDFGYTTKPMGRGMGLSISKRALQHDGLDLGLLNPGKANTPQFLIRIGGDISTE